jgi:DNA polymerase I-like protein with 3'-5' exonuclease and polymerase domains
MYFVAIDYETYYEAEYSVRDLGPRAYTLDPRFEAPIVSIHGLDNDGNPVSECVEPENFDWARISECTWISWNTGFDSTVHRRLIELGKASVYPDTWHDASHLSVFLCAGRSLKAASENLLGVSISKEVRDSMKGVRYASLPDEEKQLWKDYALKDSELCYEIWEKFVDQWPAEEMAISHHTLRMCEKGVRIDVRQAKKYEKALISGLKRVEKEIPWVGKTNPKGVPLPVTSPKQIAIYCETAGIPKPKTTAVKDPKFEKWFDDYGDKVPFVKAIQTWRKYNKLLKTVQTIITRTEPDERMEYGLFYFGAHTGRWSGAGGLNMQNLHREPVKVGRTSVDIRSLIIPRKGKKFAIVDFSQIECRVIFYLAGDEEFLDKCQSTSPYQAHAEATMGWSGGSLKKEDPRLYQLAKARCLGLGFGCGPPKFVDVARIMAGLSITLEEAEKVVKDYRDTNPKIKSLWNHLNASYKRSLHDMYEVELPSGRSLKYFGIVREAGKRFGFDYKSSTSMSGHKFKFYGGKLAENLVQACARDVLRDAILRLEDAGFNVVMHIHDEVVVEVDEDGDLDAIEELLKVVPEWLPGLPLDCEGAITDRYMK